MTPPTSTPVPRASALARFGPLAAVLVAIALVAVLASTGRDDDSVSSGAGPSSTVPPTEASAMPISYAEAVEAGRLKVIGGVTSLEEVMRVTAERGGDA